MERMSNLRVFISVSWIHGSGWNYQSLLFAPILHYIKKKIKYTFYNKALAKANSHDEQDRMFNNWNPFSCPPMAMVYGSSTQNFEQRMPSCGKRHGTGTWWTKTIIIIELISGPWTISITTLDFKGICSPSRWTHIYLTQYFL